MRKNSKDKLTKWANEPDIEVLKHDLMQAISSHSDQVSKIEYWQDLMDIKGNAKIKKQEGRSSVQPKLIRKQAEWRYSALSEPFLSSPNIFTITPRTWLDKESAKQNELILNYQFNNQLNKVKLIDSLVRCAVGDGTAVVRVSWDYEENIKEESLPIYEYLEGDQDPSMAQQITQAIQMFQQQDPQYVQLPEELKESVRASIENHRPILAVQVGEEIQEVVHVIKNQPKVDVCDIRNVIIDPTCDGNFDNANFVIYAFETCLSDLRKDGKYKNLDKIKVDEIGSDSYVPLRDDYSFIYTDEPRKKFVVYEYWGYYDIENNGQTVPIVASWAGDVIIRMEINPYPDGKIPFVVIPYLPVKNSVYGEPDAVLLEDNQKLLGALMRGLIDSMAKSANAQTGIRKDALDAVNKRKFKQGLDYEFNPNVDPKAAIISHTYPELPQSSYSMLQHLSQESEAMTGVKAFFNGLSGDSYAGQTAAGVQGTLTATGKRESSILRRLAQGIERVAIKIMAMNSAWLSDDEVIRLTDDSFIAINRSNLTGSFDIKLEINTPENNMAKAQELSFMLQTMGQILPFDLTKIILSEIAHLQNMSHLGETILNYSPQPDPLQQMQLQKMQIEVEAQKAQMQLIPVEGKLKEAHAAKSISQAHQADAQAQLIQIQAQEDASGITWERQLELVKAQAESNLQRDLAKTIATRVPTPDKKSKS